MVDITPQLEAAVGSSQIAEGLALVYTTHTTVGLFINERESGLLGDVENVLSRLVPAGAGYSHDHVDDNAASHIQSILLSPCLTLPISAGRLDLGTWQSVFLAERDGPRRRTVIVKVIGDT
jgi:secondary thiamine-phosphate synthase enzyme